ncbi:unnamed protein product [Nezara viridula]|uniref:Uncharacterized protein n=1 Tax=Nezara viridula TaxID=85310 RepID=A0A9P0MUJ6_NEZVI|nr:unnamed protein product [Nezara viridula]
MRRPRGRLRHFSPSELDSGEDGAVHHAALLPPHPPEERPSGLPPAQPCPGPDHSTLYDPLHVLIRRGLLLLVHQEIQQLRTPAPHRRTRNDLDANSRSFLFGHLRKTLEINKVFFVVFSFNR